MTSLKVASFKKTLGKLLNLIDFVLLISLYVLFQINKRIYQKISKNKNSSQAPFSQIYQKLINILDKERRGSISRVYLIEISLKNMAAKKTRSIITMGGMALGISFIVLLVSLGYGLEQLVVSRVARLEELRQADIVPGLTDELALNDKTIAQFQQIPEVKDIIPIIASVGKINYNNSQSDMAVYGVTTKYLEASAIKPSSGQIFQNDDLTVSQDQNQMAAPVQSSTSDDEQLAINFNLDGGTWYRVREDADPNSKLIGYTKLVTNGQRGMEVVGKSYDTDSGTKNKWIEAEFPIWDQINCEDEAICEADQYQVKMGGDTQETAKGYLAQTSVNVSYIAPKELPSTLTTNQINMSSDGTLPVVEIASLSAQKETEKVETIAVGGTTVKEVVVNQSALAILDLAEDQAVGATIKLTFFIVESGQKVSQTKIQSVETDYKIIGVIPDNTTPVVYVPFIDLRSLGVENYSQIKVIVEDKEDLAQVRTTIESAGFGTISVVDTIDQIDNLFNTVRVFLATLGVVAVSVAALGMFNTLTVSLLERTHEVGLMKAIGMKSSEVEELFMTESMIMGFFGGVLGLIMGILVGYALSVILSLLAITQGAGFLNVTHVPVSFSSLILLVSLMVGIGTGYIPAKRATKISALDALRYE